MSKFLYNNTGVHQDTDTLLDRAHHVLVPIYMEEVFVCKR